MRHIMLNLVVVNEYAAASKLQGIVTVFFVSYM